MKRLFAAALALLLSAGAALAADWTRTQGSTDLVGTGTSRAVALTAPVTSGDIVVGAVLLVSGAYVTSVTDEKGNVYVLTGQGSQFGNNSVQGFRSLHLITNAPQTITVHYQTSGTVWIMIDEFTPPTGTTDVSLDGAQLTPLTAAASTANYVIRNSDVLQYAVSFSNGTSTTGAGWTAAQGSTSAQCSEWRIQATPTTTANGLFATQTGNAALMISFGIAPVARTTWEIRQSQINRAVTNATTGGVTLPNPVAVGDIVVGSIAVGTPTGPTLLAGLTSFVDDKSNNYSLVPGTLGNPGGSGDRQIFWSGGMLSNAPQTITANFNATEAIILFLVAEFIPPPGTISVAVDGTGVNTTASTTSPNLTTTKPNDLLYGFEDDAGQSTTPSSGQYQISGGGASGATSTWADAWNMQPSAGITSFSWTANAGQANTALAAFSFSQVAAVSTGAGSLSMGATLGLRGAGGIGAR